jgi:hypothetical protein
LTLVRDVLLGDVLQWSGTAAMCIAILRAERSDEVVVARHEVRVAVDLHEHADLAVGVDVGLHGALGRLAARRP